MKLHILSDLHLEFAEFDVPKTDADVIIMGSRGRGGLADVTLGSASRRLLRRSAIPVMVIRLPKGEHT